MHVTFGRALSPKEGTTALALCRIADERLYARKILRGERLGVVGSVPDTHVVASSTVSQQRRLLAATLDTITATDASPARRHIRFVGDPLPAHTSATRAA